MEKRKLHILATCQYGWPVPYPSLYPMEDMAIRGHYVHAITGIPNYPMGDIFEGYEKNKIVKEVHEGVHITHVPIIPRKHNVINRFLNYHSYPCSANKEIEKLRDIFPTEIGCGELDGKFSEVMGNVEIQDDWHTDEEYSKAGDAKHDGDYLE